MRNAPSKPFPVILGGEVNCSGCENNPIRHGHSFEGSNAVFCDSCTRFIKQHRTQSGKVSYGICLNLIQTICKTCRKKFNTHARDPKVECEYCRFREARNNAKRRLREKRKNLLLFRSGT